MSFYAKAQLINKAEYFIDTDPGNGNGINIPVTTDANSTTFNMAVITTGLTPGFHHLFTRARLDDGKWSLAESRTFFISILESSSSDIAAAEYFIDSDPGHGNGIALSVGTSGSTVSFVGGVPTTGLSGGFHNLFIRAKNTAGVWSLAESRVFLISVLDSELNNIVAAEYFIDTDPGMGSGTAVSVGTAAGSVNFTASVVTTGIAPGFHSVFLRAKNSSGVWSLFEQRAFYISDQFASAADVSSAEYFIDTDPGLGKGTALNIGDSGSTATFIANIPTTGLAAGTHFLFIRAKSADGWGVSEIKEFTIGTAVATAKPAIVSIDNKTSSPALSNQNKPVIKGTTESGATVEMFNGTVSIGSTTADASGNFTVTLTTALADGQINITAKAKNAGGIESVASDAFIINIDAQAPGAPIVATVDGKSTTNFTTTNNKPVVIGTAENSATVEFFNSATSLGTSTANASGNFTFTPASALPDGNYVLTAKAKDAAGNTGVASSVFNFSIDTQAPAAPAIASVDGKSTPNFTTANNKPVVIGPQKTQPRSNFLTVQPAWVHPPQTPAEILRLRRHRLCQMVIMC